MKYSEIIQLNNELEESFDSLNYRVAIISNIMVHQSKEICEFFLRSDGVGANVNLGEYDNIVQDSVNYKNSNAVVIFWEVCNFIDGFHYKINSYSEFDFKSIINKIKTEIDLVLNNLEGTPLILINKFSLLVFNQFSLPNKRVNKLLEILNSYLKIKCGENCKIIDADQIISQLSIESAIDLRFYYSSKTLYSINFYKRYFNYIKPILVSNDGKIKKALIFDCDNTLWKGVLGEDGFDNIKIFKEVQYLALQLAKEGVIIGICSKNNLEDVDHVIDSHPDMILKDENIVIKKVNWSDKVSNLISISKELNIGLDSMVFLDDSSFEVGMVRSNIPSVTVFQVPSKEYKYGMMMREIINLFYSSSKTEEDFKRVEYYKDSLKQSKEIKIAENIDEYLKSLKMEVNVYVDDLTQVSRISQMTQKTNQFNLTTKRYTESEIKKIIKDKYKTVISISVSDKYSNSGITGLVILDNHKSYIDTFLLSCRVLGRNIEYKFIDIVIDFAKSNNLKLLRSQFLITSKNKQVSNFYENCGFNKVLENDAGSQYSVYIDKYKVNGNSYIKTIYEK